MSKFSSTLLHEIEEALDSITFGSIEIYVQDNKITQITVRSIKKTSVLLKEEQEQGEGKQTAYDDKTKVYSPEIRY